MTSRQLRCLLAIFVVSALLAGTGFGQGSKRRSEFDPIEEGDRDRPAKRAEWMSRGREAPHGSSAAALRLQAHQKKMALRAQPLRGADSDRNPGGMRRRRGEFRAATTTDTAATTDQRDG